MNEPFQLVTNCVFKGKDYLVKMGVLNAKKLEITVTNKLMAEDWQCEFDASYIETLTQKTGNYKQFEVFVAMLKSGLLKTSDSITLDLLTLEDLEHLRCKKILNHHSTGRSALQSGNFNRRYLILTYSVEFDRIHYPLPLDYCGPPDPGILQGNIRRLEAEVMRLKQCNSNSRTARGDGPETEKLQRRICQLTEENALLTNENSRLNKLLSKKNKPTKSNQMLQNTLKKLEEQVLHERDYFNRTIAKLKEEKKHIKQQIDELKTSERCLKLKLRNAPKWKQKLPRRTVSDGLSPEPSPELRRNVRGERSESQLTCRPISSWNSTVINKAPEFVQQKACQQRKVNLRSSSESDNEKPNHSGSKEAKQTVPWKQIGSKLNKTKGVGSRNSSGDRSRRGSGDRIANIQLETSRPVRRKCRSNSVRRDSSHSSDRQPTRKRVQSRTSSLSSRGSSKPSRISRCSSRGSRDRSPVNYRKSSKSGLQSREDLRFTMSDLEKRIHALQKLLSEGLSF